MTKGKERFRKFISDFYLVIILIFLYAPIFTMMVLSFNQSKSRTHWGGFTLSWYTQMFESRAIMYAFNIGMLEMLIKIFLETGFIWLIAIAVTVPITVATSAEIIATNRVVYNAYMIAKYDKNGEGTAF